MFVIAFTRFIVIAQSTNAVFYISKSVFITVAAGLDGRHHSPNDELRKAAGVKGILSW